MGNQLSTYSPWLHAWLGSLHIRIHELMDAARYLSPRTAIICMILIVLALMLIMQVWLKSQSLTPMSSAKIVSASLAPVVLLLVLLRIPASFAGTPDGNCGNYQEGKLVFTLMDLFEVPRDMDDIHGSAWVVLIVRSERWGNDTHQCRLSMSDPKVEALASAIMRTMASFGNSNGRGRITFTFGGENEVPNVTAKPKDDDPKTST